LAHELTLADIDTIRVDRPDGGIAVRVGFMMTLYFENPGNSAVRERVGRAADYFLDQFGGNMRWIKPFDARKAVPASSAGRPACASDFAKSDINHHLEFTSHDGVKESDAPVTSIGVFAPFDAPFPQLGFLTISLGIGTLAALPDGTALALVRSLCDMVQPFHGYAGLGLIRNPNPYAARKAEAAAIPLAQRFLGLELDHPIAHARNLLDGIKGVNWLTIISAALANRLGGKMELAAKCTAHGLETTDFGTGLIVKAGPAPEFGDRETTGAPAAYRIANELLKPVRQAYEDYIIDSDVDGIDPDAFTQAWLGRFD
jgi:hypothetical protein